MRVLALFSAAILLTLTFGTPERASSLSGAFSLVVDCDRATPGTQGSCYLPDGTTALTVDVMLTNLSGTTITPAAVQLRVIGTGTSDLSTTVGTIDPLNSNPDFNEDVAPNAPAGAWNCSILGEPTPDADSRPDVTDSFIACMGLDIPDSGSLQSQTSVAVASVSFVVSDGEFDITLANATAGSTVGEGLVQDCADVFFTLTNACVGAHVIVGGTPQTEPPVVDVSTWVVDTIAGAFPVAGELGDGGPALNAGFGNGGGALAFDNAGNLYFADTMHNRIRKVDGRGTVTTYAGTGVAGCSGDGGPATLATLFYSSAIAADAAGNVYVGTRVGECSWMQSGIRKIDPDGVITTFATSVEVFSLQVGADQRIYANVRRLNDYSYGLVVFNQTGDVVGHLPFSGDIAVDSAGNVFSVVGNAIAKTQPDGTMTIIAGQQLTPDVGGFAGDGLPGLLARFASPRGLAIDAWGNLYIADTENRRIRMLGNDSIVSTVAGTGSAGPCGDGGPALAACLSAPFDLVLGPDGGIFFVDQARFSPYTPDGPPLIRRLGPPDNCPWLPNPGQQNTNGEKSPTGAEVPYLDATNPVGDADGDSCDPDVDGDKLSNNMEIQAGVNLLQRDTDGDLTNDATELACGGNPTNPTTSISGSDSDRDRLPDSCEAAYGTNPNAPDTDGDGVLDGAEVRFWTSDPNDRDSDADGCQDDVEVASVNGDRQVNVIDLQQTASHAGHLSHYETYDSNGNGTVEVLDLMFMARRSGISC